MINIRVTRVIPPHNLCVKKSPKEQSPFSDTASKHSALLEFIQTNNFLCDFVFQEGPLLSENSQLLLNYTANTYLTQKT